MLQLRDEYPCRPDSTVSAALESRGNRIRVRALGLENNYARNVTRKLRRRHYNVALPQLNCNMPYYLEGDIGTSLTVKRFGLRR
jgi:hypothetical protein